MNALALMLCTSIASTLAQAEPTPSPSPAPSATPFQVKGVQVDPILSYSGIFTHNVNPTGSFDTSTGADESSRSGPTNVLLAAAKTAGPVQFGITGGLYSFPVIGTAGNGFLAQQANTNLFGIIPVAYLTYAPTGNFSISAGKNATLLGTEGTFTYQNFNIQRGIGWNEEPVVSRGVRVSGTDHKLSASLELNDGFYTARYNTFEGAISFAPSPTESVGFAFLLAPTGALPNATASIANKREYNPTFTLNLGRWSLAPYALFIFSPADGALGYTNGERATILAAPLSYTLNRHWSFGARVEYGENGGTTTETSANANLLGYGPGSTAWTFTLTPTYKNGIAVFRTELSDVVIANFAPGFGFGPNGTLPTQTRVALEVGIRY
ncbi:MAG: outer membrane beta-barrel protein [Vulcanimicrobiaceae bacterium]